MKLKKEKSIFEKLKENKIQSGFKKSHKKSKHENEEEEEIEFYQSKNNDKEGFINLKNDTHIDVEKATDEFEKYKDKDFASMVNGFKKLPRNERWVWLKP